MRQCMLALAAMLALSAGAMTTANAVEFGIGPSGPYVDPSDHYRHRDYRAYGGGECRTIISHRTNRFGEDVTVRRRVCD